MVRPSSTTPLPLAGGRPSADDDRFWESLLRRSPEQALPDRLPGRWWVAHARPRNEKALLLDLQTRAIHAYLPLCQRVRRSRGAARLSRSIVPVFTGYVFFNADEEQRRSALMTNRIVNLLTVANQGELLGELRQIQKLLSTRADFEWGPALVAGDWARVVRGPLAGLEGVVVRRVNRYRLALNVNMLSQSVQVEVPRDYLEKIDAPPYAG